MDKAGIIIKLIEVRIRENHKKAAEVAKSGVLIPPLNIPALYADLLENLLYDIEQEIEDA